jgi:hypothetical protein
LKKRLGRIVAKSQEQLSHKIVLLRFFILLRMQKFPQGWFRGEIVEYDKDTGFYYIVYSDGDAEEVDESELETILIKRRGRIEKSASPEKHQNKKRSSAIAAATIDSGHDEKQMDNTKEDGDATDVDESEPEAIVVKRSARIKNSASPEKNQNKKKSSTIATAAIDSGHDEKQMNNAKEDGDATDVDESEPEAIVVKRSACIKNSASPEKHQNKKRSSAIATAAIDSGNDEKQMNNAKEDGDATDVDESEPEAIVVERSARIKNSARLENNQKKKKSSDGKQNNAEADADPKEGDELGPETILGKRSARKRNSTSLDNKKNISAVATAATRSCQEKKQMKNADATGGADVMDVDKSEPEIISVKRSARIENRTSFENKKKMSAIATGAISGDHDEKLINNEKTMKQGPQQRKATVATTEKKISAEKTYSTTENTGFDSETTNAKERATKIKEGGEQPPNNATVAAKKIETKDEESPDNTTVFRSETKRTASMVHAATWNMFYKKLQSYHSLHGHYKGLRQDNKNLYDWLWRQRKMDALGTLLKERKERLDRIGVIWRRIRPSKSSDSEISSAKEEIATKSKEDEVPPPNNDTNNVIVENSEVKESPADVAEDATWDMRYKKLQSYHRVHSDYKDLVEYNRPLYLWLWRQRKSQAEGRLTEERKKLLDNLGVVWDEIKPSKKRKRHDIGSSSSSRKVGKINGQQDQHTLCDHHDSLAADSKTSWKEPPNHPPPSTSVSRSKKSALSTRRKVSKKAAKTIAPAGASGTNTLAYKKTDSKLMMEHPNKIGSVTIDTAAGEPARNVTCSDQNKMDPKLVEYQDTTLPAILTAEVYLKKECQRAGARYIRPPTNRIETPLATTKRREQIQEKVIEANIRRNCLDAGVQYVPPPRKETPEAKTIRRRQLMVLRAAARSKLQDLLTVAAGVNQMQEKRGEDRPDSPSTKETAPPPTAITKEDQHVTCARTSSPASEQGKQNVCRASAASQTLFHPTTSTPAAAQLANAKRNACEAMLSMKEAVSTSSDATAAEADQFTPEDKEVAHPPSPATSVGEQEIELAQKLLQLYHESVVRELHAKEAAISSEKAYDDELRYQKQCQQEREKAYQIYQEKVELEKAAEQNVARALLSLRQARSEHDFYHKQSVEVYATYQNCVKAKRPASAAEAVDK